MSAGPRIHNRFPIFEQILPVLKHRKDHVHKCTHIHTYTYIYILYADSNSLDRSTNVCKQHSIGVGEAHVLGSGEIVGPKHEQLLSINASSVIAGGVVIYKDKKKSKSLGEH